MEEVATELEDENPEAEVRVKEPGHLALMV